MKSRIVYLLGTLKKQGINACDFAEKINVSSGNVSDWKNKKRDSLPGALALSRICEKYNVNINWLLTGQGEMFITEPFGNERRADYLEPYMKEIIKLLKQLEKNERQKLFKMAEICFNDKNQKEG